MKVVYDSGSNISVVGKNKLKSLKTKFSRLTNAKFKMVSGHGEIFSLVQHLHTYCMYVNDYIKFLNRFVSLKHESCF